MSREKQIEVAVNWWADAICHPKFDNGDTSSMAGISTLLAGRLAKEVSDQQKEKFKQELSRLLSDKTEVIRLDVEYNPDPTLAEALATAEISLSNAPWKTRMRFGEDGSVKVRYGYGAEEQVLR